MAITQLASMIEICRQIAAGIWVIFCSIWLIAAIGVKQNIARRPWWLRVPVRVAIAILLIAAFLRLFKSGLLASGLATLVESPEIAVVGLILLGLGMAIAIWARIELGRNWGMPMTLKKDPELVTGGPYAWVRHPIYFGIILAMLGSVLVLGLWWIAVLAINGIQFVFAAKKEEQLMLSTFPDAYAEYRRHTWMLIPYVL